MARSPRQTSGTGIYHIMLRGINRQRLFEEPEDYQHFIDALDVACQGNKMSIFAYCLMSNHVHLLAEETNESISHPVRRLTSGYATWFNRKYDRVGHLFQNRFLSQPVEDDAYFLMAILYIHHNPVAAGLCALPTQYPWSSRRTLGTSTTLINQSRLEHILPLDTILRDEQRYQPSTTTGATLLAYPENRTLVSDERAWQIVTDICGVTTGSDFQHLSEQQQRDAVQALHDNLPVRQISRLTGLSRKLVTRWSTSPGLLT